MPPSTTRAIHRDSSTCERREQEGQSIKRGRRAEKRREAREAGSEEEKDMAVGEALAVVVAVGGVSISGAGFWAWRAYRTGQLRSGWLWLRIKTLGGVTTLEQKLRYKCAICLYSLDANEKVRKLSCGHVFHYDGSDKCTETVEKWLYERNMTCPFCRKTAIPVWPWNARPPLSAAPSASAPASSESSSGSSTEVLLPLSTPVTGEEEAEEEEEPQLTP